MDKTEIKCRFRRSVESYEENATVQKLIAERLFQLLEKYSEEVLFRIWKWDVVPVYLPVS